MSQNGALRGRRAGGGVVTGVLATSRSRAGGQGEGAEVELGDESQDVEIPDWIGEEVTFDHRYFNSNLVKLPFKSW